MNDKYLREIKKLNKRIHRQVSEAVIDFHMLEPGDKVMVCLSGGKDSYTMLDVLMTLQKRAPFPFDILAVNLDQKQPGFPAEVLPQYLSSLGVPFHIETQDTYSIVTRVIEPGKTMCSLCSRLRRGILYQLAEQFSITKIALGHHRDDIMATFFLNLFYGGNLKGMPPKLLSDDRKNIVIRPLAYVKEEDIIRYAEWKKFPIIPCNLCGSQDHLKRQAMNDMMKQWNKEHPGRLENIFNALSRVSPSHLMDRNRFDFINLSVNAPLDIEGDTAFDPLSFPEETSCGEASGTTTFKNISISSSPLPPLGE